MKKLKDTLLLFFTLIGVSTLIVVITLLLGLAFNSIQMLLRMLIIDILPFIDSYPEWLGITMATMIILFIISTVIVYFDIKETFK